jgi:hypothetical protein
MIKIKTPSIDLSGLFFKKKLNQFLLAFGGSPDTQGLKNQSEVPVYWSLAYFELFIEKINHKHKNRVYRPKYRISQFYFFPDL